MRVFSADGSAPLASAFDPPPQRLRNRCTNLTCDAVSEFCSPLHGCVSRCPSSVPSAFQTGKGAPPPSLLLRGNGPAPPWASREVETLEWSPDKPFAQTVLSLNPPRPLLIKGSVATVFPASQGRWTFPYLSERLDALGLVNEAKALGPNGTATFTSVDFSAPIFDAEVDNDDPPASCAAATLDPCTRGVNDLCLSDEALKLDEAQLGFKRRNLSTSAFLHLLQQQESEGGGESWKLDAVYGAFCELSPFANNNSDLRGDILQTEVDIGEAPTHSSPVTDTDRRGRFLFLRGLDEVLCLLLCLFCHPSCLR
jgi:hypothetical protein